MRRNENICRWFIHFLSVLWYCGLGENTALAATEKVTLDQVLARWKPLPLSEAHAAADRGDLTAQHFLGYYHSEGMAGATNWTEAVKWYQRAAEAGFANSQNNLGLAYHRGRGVPVDHELAGRWYEKAAAQGMATAMSNLARLMKEDRYPKAKYGELRDLFEREAKGGDTEAQIRFGHFLLEPPIGGILEIDNALFWYKKAFQSGRKDACFHIAETYMRWRGKEMGVLWYQRGADLGQADCRAGMSWALFNGLGIKADPKKALAIGEELAGNGHVGMMYNLGRYHAAENLPGPSPIPVDVAQALKWYRQAAERGHVQAMVTLGGHLTKGSGSEPAFKEGIGWYLKAEMNGVYEAKKQLAGLAVRHPGLVPNGLLLIEEVAEGGYDEFQFALARKYREGG